MRGKTPFELYDFLTLHIVKSLKTPKIHIIFPTHKSLPLTKDSTIHISGGRTTWEIVTTPVWHVRENIFIPEVSTLFITPTTLNQWPNPRVQPFIEKLGEGEALVTFFGFENWDSYFGDTTTMA